MTRKNKSKLFTISHKLKLLLLSNIQLVRGCSYDNSGAIQYSSIYNGHVTQFHLCTAFVKVSKEEKQLYNELNSWFVLVQKLIIEGVFSAAIYKKNIGPFLGLFPTRIEYVAPKCIFHFSVDVYDENFNSWKSWFEGDEDASSPL